MEQPPGTQKCKICLVGKSKVGKTALLNRYIYDTFDETYSPTVGIDFVSKLVDGKKLQFWDTAGQERFISLIPSYMKSATIVAFVYDVTSKDSLTAISNDYLPIFNDIADQFAQLLLIGNKTDQPDKQVSTEEGEAFALNNGMMFLEISALKFDKAVFEGKINELIEKYNTQLTAPTNDINT